MNTYFKLTLGYLIISLVALVAYGLTGSIHFLVITLASLIMMRLEANDAL